ncbi:hypothetical protein TorRG33x02_159880, partial [Trema orientale]
PENPTSINPFEAEKSTSKKRKGFISKKKPAKKVSEKKGANLSFDSVTEGFDSPLATDAQAEVPSANLADAGSVLRRLIPLNMCKLWVLTI